MPIGFLGLLTLVFVGAKLAGLLAWSWFWVLAPIIFGWTIALIILMAVLGFGLVVAIKEGK